MRIPHELNFGGRRRLPVVFSAEAAECGLACIVMIARFYGHDVDLNSMRQKFGLSLKGAPLRTVMGFAHDLGFGTRPIRVELEALEKVAKPAILHWGLGHFVVLRSVGRDGITIHDPSIGARTLSFSAASKYFTGVVLEMTPASDFTRIRARTPVRLSALWSRIHGLKRTLLQIFGLSLALQIIAFALPLQVQLVVDEAIGHADRDLLTVLAIAFGLLILIQASIEAVRDWSLQVFGNLLTFQLVANLFRHLIHLPGSYFEKRHMGDILSRIGSTAAIQDILTRGMIAALIDGGMALVAIVILFAYSAKLAWIVVASTAVSFAVAMYIYPAMRARMEEQLLASGKEQSYLMESVQAIITIKLMGREAERESAWRNHYARVVNMSVAVARFQITLASSQTAINGLQTVLILYFGARMIIDAEGFSVGMLVAFLSFRQTFSDRAQALVKQGLEFRLLGLHLDRLGDIVTAVPDAADAVPLRRGFEGRISLRGVSFRYGAGDPFVFQDVDLDIEPGEYVAIVGPSGGGKTTLLKLLLGLNKPSAGEVRLDGHLATPELWRAWRTQIGVVAQDDRLLSGSIADNIAFFDPDLDMNRIYEVASEAQIHDDIMRMPMQYFALVGDMGSSLSGGQRQRILLARALYRRPKLLFLDEGTANLDEATEELISELVSSLPITRVVVAHRPALVRRASRVIMVKDGHLRSATS